MKKLFSLLIVLSISVSLPAGKDEYEKISQKGAKPFSEKVFDIRMYDLESPNEYDEDVALIARRDLTGDLLQIFLKVMAWLSPPQAIDSAPTPECNAISNVCKLERRKRNRVIRQLINPLLHYRNMVVLSPSAAAGKLAHGTIDGSKDGVLVGRGEPNTVALGAILGAFSSLIKQIIYDPDSAAKCDDIDRLIERIEALLKNDPIVAVERAYIEQQADFLIAERTHQRRAIESALISYYENPISIMGESVDYLKLVQEILALPRHTLLVPAFARANSLKLYKEDRDAFLDAVFPSLKTGTDPEPHTEPALDSVWYSKTVRLQLRDALRAICDRSSAYHLAKDRLAHLPRGFILYGTPGTGKSKAAELVAKACGLPYFVMKIEDAKDLSAASLEGKLSSFKSAATKGKFGEAFCTTVNRDGKQVTAKNVVVVLEDVDRGFGKDNDALLAFLMHLFFDDKSRKSEYFGFELDTQDMVIIATVNRDLRTDSKFKALLDRAPLIEVPKPKRQLMKQVIMSSITDQAIDYSQWDFLQPHDRHELRERIANFLLNNFYTDTGRELTLRANNLLDASRDDADWDEYATDRGWEAKEYPLSPDLDDELNKISNSDDLKSKFIQIYEQKDASTPDQFEQMKDQFFEALRMRSQLVYDLLETRDQSEFWDHFTKLVLDPWRTECLPTTADALVDMSYCYDGGDVWAVLWHRLGQTGAPEEWEHLESETRPMVLSAGNGNYVLPPAQHPDPIQSLQAIRAGLLEVVRRYKTNETIRVAIPVHLVNHWVVVLIEVRQDGATVRYIDSFRPHPFAHASLIGSIVNQALQEQFGQAYPTVLNNEMGHEQTDGAACGALAVENLLCALQANPPAAVVYTTERTRNLRLEHMALLGRLQLQTPPSPSSTSIHL